MIVFFEHALILNYICKKYFLYSRDNRILIEGVKAIAKVLPTCENLKTLKV